MNAGFPVTGFSLERAFQIESAFLKMWLECTAKCAVVSDPYLLR